MGSSRICVVLLLLALGWAGGCGAWHATAPPAGPAGSEGGIETPIQNPLLAPVADREFLWNQLVETVDGYFQIEREDRVKLVGEVLTEGQIDTYPAIASTLLEPWAPDSTPGYERLHATVQSIRRRASVRVVPTQGGYLIHLAVYKEKEELAQPEHATVGSAVRRYDESRQSPNGPLSTRAGRSPPSSDPMHTPATLGWIRLGRDISLEQRMLGELRARLFNPPGRG